METAGKSKRVALTPQQMEEFYSVELSIRERAGARTDYQSIIAQMPSFDERLDAIEDVLIQLGENPGKAVEERSLELLKDYRQIVTRLKDAERKLSDTLETTT